MSVAEPVHLRCAWLRHHAELLYAVDPSGLLSAQLADFADLLEAVASDGRLERA